MANATTPVIQINEGKVGIGTTSPTADLHIQGSSATDVPILRVGGFGNSGSKLELVETLSVGNMAYGYSFFNDGNSTNKLYVKAHNNSTTGVTAFNIDRGNALTTFNVNPVVGTRTAGDNTTRAASTAFVTAAVSGSPQGTMSSWILKEGNGTETSTVTNGETVTFAQGTGIQSELTSTSSGGTITITNTAPDTGVPAILNAFGTPLLNGISAAQIRSLIGAGTSNLQIGTTSTTAKAGNITTISSGQATAITANTAKVTDSGVPAILSNGSTPTLNSGISAAEVRTLIGAGTSSTTGTVTKSGTPVNNQLAVWTSATNIEGEGELTYDGVTLRVGGTGNTTTSLEIIGTNTAGAPATAAALKIYGYEGRGEGIFYYDSAYSGQEWYSGLPYSGGNTYQIGFDASGNQAQYTANAIMRMDALKNTTFSGKVGINTAPTTTSLLNIKGNATGDNTPQITISSGGVDNNAILQFDDDDGSQICAVGALEGNILTCASVGDFLIKTNSGSITGTTNTRLYINQSGNVGIGTGTATPLGRLDVNGNINGTGSLVLRSGSSTYFSVGSYQGNPFINTGTSGGTIFLGAPAAFVTNLNVAGTATATNFILSSDERLKENIKTLEPRKIDIKWKSFNLKTDDDYRTGVIAQELEKTNPEFVREDSKGFKSVAYIDLLIAKIAELEARLEKAGI